MQPNSCQRDIHVFKIFVFQIALCLQNKTTLSGLPDPSADEGGKIVVIVGKQLSRVYLNVFENWISSTKKEDAGPPSLGVE